MRSLQLKDHLSDADLRSRLVSSRGTMDHSRWQLLYLIQIGGQHSADVLAPLVDLSVHSVYKIVEGYNREGPSTVRCKQRGGRRRSLLTLEQEEDLFVSLEQKALKGELKTAGDIRALVEKTAGRVVSDDYLWDLLKRNGWKKKMPRPHHPKSNRQQQEDFKKNSPNVWMPPL
jgi:transposase